jgi:hypothetical protein
MQPPCVMATKGSQPTQRPSRIRPVPRALGSGIDSISVMPDRFARVQQQVAAAEADGVQGPS